ncbi:MAG: hypothetical protein AAF446_10055 [Pseudomonadota bacterium]
MKCDPIIDISQGQIRARIDSADLAHINDRLQSHNRRTPGAIVAAGFLIAAALLAAYDVGPFVRELSIPSLLSFGASALLIWRIWR